ncbi:hypothetical protein AVEN_11851-1 [Araneus ventricosus]|uniref:Uncharacterized protein n=1 Tax=Araneus ventricosus TaxID=182803 RepID=A0A4Y2ATM3_ARAVE|nr:hypothetical protein AVEN_256932-1 [Araneus ventricosus]GBL82679.1 hypothetical protein AVEN_200858-1 [Araneus ventricosus]GBL83716.1 hypothetical protein AVEN_259794-1 [Araneus ventricosus]GBL83741.1 hypothetical protein AVEN_11851-1 [Araneus ventricosus]
MSIKDICCFCLLLTQSHSQRLSSHTSSTNNVTEPFYQFLEFLINFELSFMNLLYFDFYHSTVFPDFLFIMKRASSESASSTTSAKKPSTFNNTGGFTADSIPQHHYYLGENNYAAISDFEDVLNVYIRKFKTNENG